MADSDRYIQCCYPLRAQNLACCTSTGYVAWWCAGAAGAILGSVGVAALHEAGWISRLGACLFVMNLPLVAIKVYTQEAAARLTLS